MGKKLYVGNLAYSMDDAALEQLFAPHGTVQSAQVIMDRDTGRSKGFGFVEMGSDQEAQAAIAAKATTDSSLDVIRGSSLIGFRLGRRRRHRRRPRSSVVPRSP